MSDQTAQVSTPKGAKTMDDYPSIAKRVVRHGLFWYFKPEEHVVNGEEKVLLVQHTAFAGETVDVHLNTDLERAEKYGALHSEEESQERIARQAVLLPEPAVSEDEGEDGEEVELADLEDDELVDWLMSTGEFDGNKKPTGPEVVTAVGDDKALAERVLRAENVATGDNPRENVKDPLTKVIESEGGE
jgi:hypothetical protein